MNESNTNARRSTKRLASVGYRLIADGKQMQQWHDSLTYSQLHVIVQYMHRSHEKYAPNKMNEFNRTQFSCGNKNQKSKPLIFDCLENRPILKTH